MLIILGIIVASLAIFIVLSRPARTTSAPAHSFLIQIDQHSSVTASTSGTQARMDRWPCEFAVILGFFVAEE